MVTVPLPGQQKAQRMTGFSIHSAELKVSDLYSYICIVPNCVIKYINSSLYVSPYMDNYFMLHTYINIISNQYTIMLVVVKDLWINFDI